MLRQCRWKALALQFQVAEIHCEGEFWEEELSGLGRVRQCPVDVSTGRLTGNPRALPDVAQVFSRQLRPQEEVSCLIARQSLPIANRRLEQLLKLCLV